MYSVFVNAHNIISSLGNTSEQNFSNILKRKSGIKQHQNLFIDNDIFFASLIEDEFLPNNFVNQDVLNKLTRFEQLCIASISNAIANTDINVEDERTIFILSSTKGNIALLENIKEISSQDLENLSLFHSSKKITSYFKNYNNPIVISNACISGVASLIYAKRILEAGKYDHAVIIGADIITKFVFSGFKSFNALSTSNCKPFSNDRDGINLGEAAGTIILSRYKKKENDIQILAGSLSNDANHISGPSKTGVELCNSINNTLFQSKITINQIDFISAHGTATMYNDEMEAKAFYLAGFANVTVNSLKGYFGHTLGAAGIIESIISILSLQNNITIPTLGFAEIGVSVPITICQEQDQKPLQYLLKTASGFGGCNASLLLGK